MRLLFLLPLLSVACASSVPSVTTGPTVPGHALVVSVSQPASEVGARVLRDGGNAVDAAVATAFALAVTFPEAGNIGGGGFMLVQPGRRRSAGKGPAEPAVIDYRETAPAGATAGMFAAADARHPPSSESMVGV